MALTKELLHLLDDENEPLAKRIKIADNALKSSKLPIQNREGFLLSWISSLAKNNDTSIWPLLLNWLTSLQIQEISRNDVTLKDLRNLTDVITHGLKTVPECSKSVIISCAIALIENRTFQLFFKHEICEYCEFVSKIMSGIDDQPTLSRFLATEQLFNKHMIATDDFPKHFIRNILIEIINILNKFSKRTEVFLELSAIVEKCLFHRNFKLFSNYFKVLYENEKLDETMSILPKMIFKDLMEISKEFPLSSVPLYKIIFHAFCTAYNSNFDFIYKFFIILHETLGFDMASYINSSKIKKFRNPNCSIDTSVAVLSELYYVLQEFNKESNYKVQGISFTEFIKNVTISVISLIQPVECVYKLLISIITIDPLITEQILNDLLFHTMLSKKDATKAEYERSLIAVFEIFAKLHRMPNLISKMIPLLKSAVEGSFQPTPSIITFNGLKDDYKVQYNFMEIMPDKVLNHFHQYITTFASWQVINLFKTLHFHFESAVHDLSVTYDDTSKFVYIEFISSLIAQFLCSVRIAEHTTTTSTVEKFMKHMEELRNVLKTFGTTLVKMEHGDDDISSGSDYDITF